MTLQSTRPTTVAAPPTLGHALRQPRSIGYLVIALVVAAIFAALGQWQLQRATAAGTVIPRTTETVKALTDIATPQQVQTAASVGQLVTTTGSWVPGDFLVIGDRLNSGHLGYWVSGHLLTTNPAGAQLAVAVGWTSSRSQADAVTARLNAQTDVSPVALRGRYIDSDTPDANTDSQGDGGSALAARASSTPQDMAVPQLLNLWKTDTSGPVYAGVLTLHAAPAGLTAISSPAPTEQVELNLLNLFYAAEWALFAVVAFYIWYRLIRDRWEQDMDELAEAQTGESGT